MEMNKIFSLENSGCFEDSLTELLKSTVQQMLEQAIEVSYVLPRTAQCSGFSVGSEKRPSPDPPGSDWHRTGCGVDAESGRFTTVFLAL